MINYYIRFAFDEIPVKYIIDTSWFESTVDVFMFRAWSLLIFVNTLVSKFMCIFSQYHSLIIFDKHLFSISILIDTKQNADTISISNFTQII